MADPDLAAPLPGAVELLDRLASRYAVVVVVSGRPLSYLRRHLDGAGDTELVGLYGFERARGGSLDPQTVPEVEAWRGAVEAAASAAEEAAPPGVMVERKGFTVTVHYRVVPLQAERVLATAKAIAETTGLVWHPGKMSVEIRPPLRTDKGSVVAELASGLGAVCFIGDDRGDLPAFQELARVRRRGVTTLAVAVSGAETPSEVLDSADLVVDGPAGVMELLGQLDHGRP